MTKFCIVAPPQVLQGLAARGLMGMHHLLLAHDVVAQAQKYESIFKYRTWDKADELIIMDNSVIETGNAVDLKMMAEAIAIVRPTVVVLPDVLLDGEATAQSCLYALDTWPRYLPDTTRYCYIPQGKKLTEFIASARALADHELITFWGCPRNVVKYHGSRNGALNVLKDVNPSRKIHMMGFSDNMEDDITCAKLHEVESIDSAVPLRINHPLYKDGEPKPRGDWWETGAVTMFTVQNLQIARQWFQ